MGLSQNRLRAVPFYFHTIEPCLNRILLSITIEFDAAGADKRG